MCWKYSQTFGNVVFKASLRREVIVIDSLVALALTGAQERKPNFDVLPYLNSITGLTAEAPSCPGVSTSSAELSRLDVAARVICSLPCSSLRDIWSNLEQVTHTCKTGHRRHFASSTSILVPGEGDVRPAPAAAPPPPAWLSFLQTCDRASPLLFLKVPVEPVRVWASNHTCSARTPLCPVFKKGCMWHIPSVKPASVYS